MLGNYVWENGQNQESSRDQQHAFFGLGHLRRDRRGRVESGRRRLQLARQSPAQGLRVHGALQRLVLASFPDQTTPWEPTGAESRSALDRTGRWFSKQINPYFESDFVGLSRGDFPGKRPVFEQPLAHYRVRMGLPSQTLWTERGRDVSVERGGLEGVGFSLDHAGWGALTFRRPSWAAGDRSARIRRDGLPVFGVPELPGTLEAVHYDHFPVSGEGHTYHDTSPGNSGAQYRADDVDIICGDGNRHVRRERRCRRMARLHRSCPRGGQLPHLHRLLGHHRGRHGPHRCRWRRRDE